MERKLTDREYHVQDNADVEHQDMKMYCNTNKSPKLSFSDPHSKPHGARGLSKHYNLRFDPKLGMGICAILRILCACVACTSMLDKPSTSDIPSYEQERYKPVTKCNYWPLLGSFNNKNIIQLSPKSTSSDTFDEIHYVVIDIISDNMALLFESGKYGAINTTDLSTNGFYVIIFTSGAYTLQENKKNYGHIITADELVVKAQYLCSMQVDTNWYRNQQLKHHVITVPTRTTLHTQLEVNTVTDFHTITTSECFRTQEKKSISR